MNAKRQLEMHLDALNSSNPTPQLIRRTEEIIDYAIAQKQELEDAIASTSQALSRAKQEQR